MHQDTLTNLRESKDAQAGYCPRRKSPCVARPDCAVPGPEVQSRCGRIPRLRNFNLEPTTQMTTSDMVRSDGGCKRSTPPRSINGASSTDTTTIGHDLVCLIASNPRPCEFDAGILAVRCEAAAQLAVVESCKGIWKAERDWVVPLTGSRFKMDDHLAMNLLNRPGHPEHFKCAKCRCARGSLARTDGLRIDYEYRRPKPCCFARCHKSGKAGTGNDQIVGFSKESLRSNRFHVEV